MYKSKAIVDDNNAVMTKAQNDNTPHFITYFNNPKNLICLQADMCQRNTNNKITQSDRYLT